MARTRRVAAVEEAAQAAASAQQKADATAAAMRAVFETAELLEMILLQLPLNELLLVQQVSASWRDNMRQSKKIQQALYLGPFGDELLQSVGTSPVPWGPGYWMYKDNNESEVVVRPILNPIMPRYFFYWHNEYCSILHIGFVNPIFRRTAYKLADERRDTPMAKNLGPRSERRLRSLHRPQASWKAMFLMQPPCKEIKIICGASSSSRPGGRTFTIANPQGVTLQDLRVGICEHWTACPLDPFSYMVERWDFEGDTTENIQLLKAIPTSAELLDCLERPETDSLPEVHDDFI